MEQMNNNKNPRLNITQVFIQKTINQIYMKYQ